MFCLISANAVEVKVTVHDTYKWLSSCHVGITEHGFDNPNDTCFCVRETDKDNYATKKP